MKSPKRQKLIDVWIPTIFALLWSLFGIWFKVYG